MANVTINNKVGLSLTPKLRTVTNPDQNRMPLQARDAA
jgi:hypothetical protein